MIIDLSLSLIIAGWGQILNILWFASAQCLKTDRFRGLSKFTTWMCPLKQINTDAYEMVSFLTRLLLNWHRFLRSGSGRLFSPRDALQLSLEVLCGNTRMSDRARIFEWCIFLQEISAVLPKLYLKTLKSRIDSILKERISMNLLILCRPFYTIIYFVQKDETVLKNVYCL